MRNIDPRIIARAKAFLTALIDHGGAAQPRELCSPDRIEDRARQLCCRRGLAMFVKASSFPRLPSRWVITNNGRAIESGEDEFSFS